MSSVDDRIVNMQFNNKQFVSGANESEKALMGLEKTLANTGKGKGIDQLGNAVDQTSKKFSIMQIAGVTAVATIANKAVNAAGNLLKSLTIDPILDGFNEYQTNLKSVQTIMANTGKSVGTVNKYLEDMNHFSDMTIYNFSEMARNLGTFTAAGVGLKDAKASIQGIANIAALSGSSSQQASTAMYQLSQAIAAGRVGLQDWNSVVNAGMGGKKLQNALAQTAVAMGALDKNAISSGKNLKIMGQSFRDSIASKPGKVSWLNSDVLTKTLAIMDGGLSRAQMRLEGITDKSAQDAVLQKKRAELIKQGVNFTDQQWKSMVKMANASFKAATEVKTFSDLIGTVRESIGSLWASTFQSILGNFTESKKMWTAVNSVISGQIGALGQALNGKKIKDANGVLVQGAGILRVWRKEGGRDDFFSGIGTGLKAFASILGQVKGAFQDVFGGGDTAQSLINFSAGFKNLMENLKPSEKTLGNLRDIFGGVFAVLHIGVTIIKGIATAFGSFFGTLFKGSAEGRSGVLEFFAGIGKALQALDKAITSGGKVSDVFAGIGAAAGAVVGPIVKMVGYLLKGIAALATGKGFSGFAASFEGVKGAFADLVSLLAGAGATITAPFESLSGWFDKIQDKANSFKSTLSGVTDVFGGFGGGGDGMEKAAGPIEKTSKSLITATASMVGLKNASADVSTSGEKISNSLGHITTSTDGVKKSLGSMASTMGTSFDKAADSVTGLDTATSNSQTATDRLKTALSILGTAVQTSFKAIGTAAGWISDQFGKLFGGKDALDWAALMNAVFTGGVLLAIRKFIKLLDQTVAMAPGLLATFHQTMMGVRDTLDEFAKGMVKAALIRAIAISVGVLVASLIALSLIPAEKLGYGLGALASVMTILVGSMFALSKIEDLEGVSLSISAAFLAISQSVLMLTGAVLALSLLPLDKLAAGIGGVGVLIGFMVGSMLALSKISGQTAVAASSMVALAFAVNLLTLSVLALSVIPMDNLAKGIGALAALMALMVGSMVVMSSFGKFAVGGATAMIGMAVAVGMLVPAIVALGSIKAGTIWKGIGALAAVVLVLTASLVALSLAGPATILAGASLVLFALSINMLLPAIIALGLLPWGVILKALGALVLLAVPITLLGVAALVAAPGFLALGAALLLAGTGMFLFGTGFAVLTAAGVAGVGILVVAFQAFLALLPQLGIQLAAAMVSFIETIAASSTRLRAAFSEIFAAILGVIQDSIPTIVALINELVNGMFDVLENAIPRAAQYFTKVIQAGLKAIRKLIPDFVETGWAVLEGVLTGIENHIDDVVDKGIKIIRKLIRGLAQGAVDLADEIGQAILTVIEGITAAIEKYDDRIRDAGFDLMGALINGMTGGLAGRISDALSGIGGMISDAIPGDIPGVPLLRVNAAQAANDDKEEKKANKKAKSTIKQLAATFQATMISGLNQGLQAGVFNALQKVMSLINQGSSLINSLIEASYAKQIQSSRAQIQADILSNTASKLKGKGSKKAQNKINKAAAQAQKEADYRQREADRAQARLDQATRVQEAAGDNAALADAQTQNATELGQEARDKLAEAQGAQAAAAKLEEQATKVNKKQAKALRAQAKALRDQAARLVVDANNLAVLATQAQAAAAQAAAAAIDDQIKAITEKHDAEIKEEQDAKAFEEADQQGKIDILQKRHDDAQAKAEKAEQDYQNALKLAQDAKNAGNIALAQQYLDQAAEFSDIANASRDAAQQALDDMKNLTDSGSSGVGGGTLTPSASILENAASTMDSFTKSMQEAMEAAGATPPLIQFNQTNNSPEALNPSEVYRQSNNLLSFAATRFTPVP